MVTTTYPTSLGSSAVDWLFTNVEGFIDRRHAKKYCSLMLKDGYIKHTVNKLSFSEQCYYVFGDIFSPTKTVYKTPSELEHGECLHAVYVCVCVCVCVRVRVCVVCVCFVCVMFVCVVCYGI